MGSPLRFKKSLGHKDFFYIDDKYVDFKDVIEAPFPKAPLDTSIFCHWLAIEGVQPATPENAPIEVIAAIPDTKKLEQKTDELPVDIRLPVKHVLSRELQLEEYYRRHSDSRRPSPGPYYSVGRIPSSVIRSKSYSPRDKYSRSRFVSSRPRSESSRTPASRSPSRSLTPPSSSTIRLFKSQNAAIERNGITEQSRHCIGARSLSRSMSRSRSPSVRSD